MILRFALILTAIGAALVPLPASSVEFLYSQRAYLGWQRFMTGLSNRMPFALFDVLIVCAVAWLLFTLGRFGQQWRSGGVVLAAGTLVARAAAAAALVYLVFLAGWGLNYRRVPLTSRLAFSQERVTAAATASLARTIVARASEVREAAQGGEPAARASRGVEWDAVPALLGPSFARVQQQLSGATPAVPGTPKGTLLTLYFERSGVDGMTDPFFLETLVNGTVLPFERPFIAAHEWAHLAGYADESEANFIGWLVCLQGPPAAEYSGHLALLWQLLPALPRGERERAVRQLSDGVRADLNAMAARAARATPAIRRLSWRVYDRYLKANRVGKGVESYDAALELMLGTRFTEGWVPQPAASR